jgi:hypothetical protein
MKFTVDAAAWKATLKDVAAVLPGNPINPVHQMVLIEADRSEVTVRTTDGHQHLVASCVASVAAGGVVCTPGAILIATSAGLQGSVAVELVGRDRGNELDLSDATGRARLRVGAVDPAAFPQGDEGLQTLWSFTADGPALAALLKVAASALPKEGHMIPGHLDGLAFDLERAPDGTADLGLVASDNRRMAIARMSLVAGGSPERHVATMGSSCVDLAISLCRRSTEVRFAFSSGLGNLRIDLVEYTFPLTTYDKKLPWRKGQPADPVDGADVDAPTLAGAVARAVACSKSETEVPSVLLECELGAGLTVRSAGQSGHSEVRCPLAASRGEPGLRLEVRTSAAFLLQHLRSLGDGNVSLGFVGAGKVCKGQALTLRRDNIFITLAGMGIPNPEPPS